MTQRIILGLEPDGVSASIGSALRSFGAEIVRGPSRNTPDVMVISIPADADVDEFLRKAKALKGVKYAEPDSWQSTF